MGRKYQPPERSCFAFCISFLGSDNTVFPFTLIFNYPYPFAEESPIFYAFENLDGAMIYFRKKSSDFTCEKKKVKDEKKFVHKSVNDNGRMGGKRRLGGKSGNVG